MALTPYYCHKKFDAYRSRKVIPTTEEPTLSSSPALRYDSPYTAFSAFSSPSTDSESFQSRKRRRFSRDARTPLLKRIKLETISLALDSESAQSPQSPGMEASINLTMPIPLNSARLADSATASALPISADTLREICKYHGNMVRKFPKKERTPKDQDRRNKNTIACRLSRRVKKLEHVAIEEEYKLFAIHHFQLVEQSMRATGYFNYLTHLIKVTANSHTSKMPASPTITTAEPSSKNKFSIDYIMGIEAKKDLSTHNCYLAS